MNESSRYSIARKLRVLVFLSALASLFLACGAIAASPGITVPERAAWLQTNDILDGEKDGHTVVNVFDGEKWRAELGFAEKALVRVFDGKTLKSSDPRDTPGEANPVDFLKGLPRWIGEPINEPGAKQNVGTAYHFGAPKDDGILYLGSDGFPSRLIVKVNGKVKFDARFKLLSYDVAAHANELFDIGDLRPHFVEYLPSLPKSQAAAPPAAIQPPPATRSPFVEPKSAVWLQTADIFEGEKSGQTMIEVVDGEKWREEAGYADKTLVKVFDGKTLKANFPVDPAAELGPRFFLKGLLAITAQPPISDPSANQTGGKCYRFVMPGNEAFLYVDGNGFPSREIMKVDGKLMSAVQFKSLAYDVSAHSAELFDTGNLKPCFAEYLPPAPKAGTASPRIATRLPKPNSLAPSILEPERATWLQINHGPVKDEASRTVVQVISGAKWRAEGGFANHPYVAVFDGMSVKANSDVLKPDTLDPHFMLRSTLLAASVAKIVETTQVDGKMLTVYHSKLGGIDMSLYVNPDKTPARMLTQVGEQVSEDLEYRTLPFDVKAHEAELFDTNNLKPYFSRYLAPETTPGPDANRTTPTGGTFDPAKPGDR